MDNPVDHSIDLGFVNYVQHPSNPQYVVYRFKDEGRAKSFEAELVENKIWFEYSTDQKNNKPYYLFGIHKNDFKKTQAINYKVEGIHKKPFIPFKGLRLIVMTIGFGLILLAIIGYCKQQEKIRQLKEEYHLNEN